MRVHSVKALRWLAGRATAILPKWLLASIIGLVPESLLAKLLDPKFKFGPNDVPAPPVAPATPIRLFVAPVNFAGQGWQWARAAERNVPGVGAVSMAYAVPGDFAYPSDNLVPVGVYAVSRRWQRAQRKAITERFTHVLLEAERPPFGAIINETVQSQVREILAAGLKVALVCHGSDIRSPSRHAAAEPYSHFRDLDPSELRPLEEGVARNHAVITELDLPVFVSTPDLLADVPTALWMPVIVDATRWANDYVPMQRARPIIAHAPSKGHVKGSDMIDPVMERLADEGVIEYRRVSGVASDKMPEVYRDADIVLDQFRIGTYGVASCEAMAAGRVVVSHVDTHSREMARAKSGIDLPMIEATPATVEAVIRGIIADPAPAQRIAARGPEFIAALHDGRYSASVLAGFLGQAS